MTEYENLAQTFMPRARNQNCVSLLMNRMKHSSQRNSSATL